MSDPEIVVLVAHPDDEVLWFASVLPRAERVIVAFGPYAAVPDLAAARDEAVAELPFRTTFLRMNEAGSYAMADWASPTMTPFGLALDHAQPDVRHAYESNYLLLRDRLRRLLQPGQHVFSHNPWGEYGHEDHVLAFRAVEDLRQELHFEHWVPAYVSDRSATLAQKWQRSMGQRSQRAVINPEFTASIEAIYQKHRCWTWDSDWVWPKEEWFYRMGDSSDVGSGSDEPELIKIVRA